MQWFEIGEFIDSLKNIEMFVSELAAREAELRYSGIGSSKLWASYGEARKSFEGFDRKLYELVRLSKHVDRGLYEQIKEILDSSSLAEGVSQISVSIRVAERRRETIVAMRKAATSILDVLVAFAERMTLAKISQGKGLFFSDFEVSLSRILVALNRLIPLSEEVEGKYFNIYHGEDEIFKPANINIENITNYIEFAINEISDSPEVGLGQKEDILKYLDEVRLELADETPKWRKIVGALVIVSTILSGLAVAPQAIENVQKAVTEILGTSVKVPSTRSIPKLGGGDQEIVKT